MQRTLVQLLHHVRQLVLGKAEERGNGIELRDQHQPVGVAGVHQVAGIHQPQPGDAVDRGADLRIVEAEAGRVDLRLVELHRSFELSHQRRLIVGLLVGDQLLRDQLAIAIEVQPGALELRLVAGQRALGLVELVGEGARIDARKHLAGLDQLPLAEEHLLEPPVHLRAHRHRLEGGHAAQPLQVDGHVAALDHAGDHRHGPAGRRLLLARRARLLLGGAFAHEERHSADEQHGDGGEDDPSIPHERSYLRPSARKSWARAVESLSSA